MIEKPTMTEEDLLRLINKQKNGKAARIDGVKAEAMKHLVKNKKIWKTLLRAFNYSLDEEVNRRWLESKTTMIPKTNRPQYKEHRPMPVTVWSSKIICGFLREIIEEHLENWA